jgi:hypothetical protein
MWTMKRRPTLLRASEIAALVAVGLTAFARPARADVGDPFAPASYANTNDDAEGYGAPPARGGRHALAAKLESGAFLREIFTLPIDGPEFSFALGRESLERHLGTFEPFFYARYAYGQTPEGLGTHTARLGGSFDFVFGRVRPFIDANLLWLAIERASTADIVSHWGIGLGAGLSVDLVQTSATGALYLAVRTDVDIFPHVLVPRTLSPLGALTAGIRF